MTRDEYDERLRALEAQLQSDIALVHAGHEARVRSLGSLWQTAAPAPVPKKTARPAWSTLDEIEEALPRLPEVFDKRDITRILGYTPPYSTLLRALAELTKSGEIADNEGAYRSEYRKISRSTLTP